MALSLLTLFVAVVALGFGARLYRQIRTERLWPTVPGRILERGVGEPMGRGRNYIPHARYTYVVDGQNYTNDQVYLIRRTGGFADTVRKLVDDLPDPVPVHYDPADPSRSFLVTNPTSTVWITLIFGGLALVWGLMDLMVSLFGTQGAP